MGKKRNIEAEVAYSLRKTDFFPHKTKQTYPSATPGSTQKITTFGLANSCCSLPEGLLTGVCCNSRGRFEDVALHAFVLLAKTWKKKQADVIK
jgi:hypothetical protein